MKRRPTRLLSSLACIGLLAAAFAPTPESTEASWTDADVSGATFKALQIPAPVGVNNGCIFNPGLLGSTIGLTWKQPEGLPAGAAAVYALDSTGLLSDLTNVLLPHGKVQVHENVQQGTITATTSSTGLIAVGAKFAVRYVLGDTTWGSSWLQVEGKGSIISSSCTISLR